MILFSSVMGTFDLEVAWREDDLLCKELAGAVNKELIKAVTKGWSSLLM